LETLIKASRLLAAGPAGEECSWVECRDGRIARLGGGKPPRTPDEDLGGMLVAPGLINAHCHLDYTHLRGMLRARRGFADWIGQINALKRHSSLEDFCGAIRAGFDEAVSFGTTSMVNIESYPDIVAGIVAPIRTWWAIEAIDLRTPFEFGILPELRAVSPHSPYTASAGLYRRAARIARATGAIFTTHVGESGEEDEMFSHAAGPLFELFDRMGRDMSDCGHGGSLGLLLDECLLPPRSLLAHLNYFNEGDLARCAAAGHAVVHCPRSHSYFGHRTFAFDAIRDAGISVSLATDSLASCRNLSLFDEMRCFAEKHPSLKPAEVVDMVTRAPAAALGMAGDIGLIAPNACADLIAVPDDGDPDPASVLLRHRGTVPFVMAGGNILRQERQPA